MAAKLLGYHGRKVTEWGTKIEARAYEQILSVDEIFNEILYQMETQERAADFRLARDHFGETNVREVDSPPRRSRPEKRSSRNSSVDSQRSLDEKRVHYCSDSENESVKKDTRSPTPPKVTPKPKPPAPQTTPAPKVQNSNPQPNPQPVPQQQWGPPAPSWPQFGGGRGKGKGWDYNYGKGGKKGGPVQSWNAGKGQFQYWNGGKGFPNQNWYGGKGFPNQFWGSSKGSSQKGGKGGEFVGKGGRESEQNPPKLPTPVQNSN